MKITIAYLPAEDQEAADIQAAILRRFPGAKIHKSEAHPPYKHIYLTTKNAAKPTGARDRA